VGRAHEAPADGERRRRPIGGLLRFGILAGGELDEEAAAELVGSGSRAGAEIAGSTICGSAAQSQMLTPECQREHEACRWSDPPFAVGLDKKIPAIGAEFNASAIMISDVFMDLFMPPKITAERDGGQATWAQRRASFCSSSEELTEEVEEC
jgi:hypothetical protein